MSSPAAVKTSVTAGWSRDELQTFTTLFKRFLDDLSSALPVDASCLPTTPEENR